MTHRDRPRDLYGSLLKTFGINPAHGETGVRSGDRKSYDWGRFGREV